MAGIRDRRNVVWLLAPALLVVGLTTIYPLGFSFWTSFHDWRLIKSVLPGDFIGLENYEVAFTDDPVFWGVIRVTARFVVIDVVATILAALGLAILMMRAGIGHSIVRTLMILPFAVSPALIGITWKFMFNPEYGAVNRGIGAMLPFMDQLDWFALPATCSA